MAFFGEEVDVTAKEAKALCIKYVDDGWCDVLEEDIKLSVLR